MSIADPRPKFFDALSGEAVEVKTTPYGQVGGLYSDPTIEMVWVSKQGEAIDTGWFCQEVVDLLVVVQGQLKVEFEADPLATRVMKPGEVLILPPDTKCRAYRWPREAALATVFIALYPPSRATLTHR